NALAMLWREHAMPSIAELTEAHYVTARRLFLQAAPFAGEIPTPPALATDHQRDDIRRRLSALPADIASTVTDGADELRHLMAVGVFVADCGHWDRLLVPGEPARARRHGEMRKNLPHFRSIAATLHVTLDQLTSLDFDHDSALHEAHG